MEEKDRKNVRTNYVLIDYENVQPEAVSRLNAEHFKVIVFLGASQTKVTREVVIALHRMGDKAEYIEISGNGKNALDFHIAYYIGKYAANDPTAFFHIISKDKGFDPLTKHLETEHVFVKRSDDVSSLLKTITATSSDAPKTVPAKSSAKKKATAKSPAKKKIATIMHQAKPEVKSADTTEIDKQLAAIVSNLHLRGEAKPRTGKTLKSTISVLFKNRLQENELDELLSALQEKGIVIVDGAKVSYSLPPK